MSSSRIRKSLKSPALVLAVCVLSRLATAAGDVRKPAAEPFDLKDVKLLDGPFKTAMDRNAEYLLLLQPDRFLHYFRTEAGLPPRAPAYPGWESPNEGEGRCLGHYLSALSLQYRASQDVRFKQRVDYIVDQLADVQTANGNGYIGAEANGRKFWADLAAGNAEALRPYRVPWYIQHKLFAGLRDAYQLAGNDRARDVLIRLSDWAISVTSKLSDDDFQSMLKQEHGGMREVLCDVYAITGEKKYLDLAARFYHQKVIDPLTRQQDDLTGLHANTQIPKLIGEARWYELTGETEHQQAARFFWETVVHTRTYANGGNSDHEKFGKPYQLANHLNNTTSETCNTYNMLKLTQHLFEWDPKVEYPDYTERALYNHILASTGPAPGNFTYYVPMETGHFRTYSEPESSFWCCVGTGMENHTKYAQSIFYHDTNSVFVNLFIPSELNWNGLKIRQETDYPASGKIGLTISGLIPPSLTIRIRYPGWAPTGAAVTLNAEYFETDAAPGSYIGINRHWIPGDRIEINLPLSLRTEPTPDDPNKLAIFYGPLLLSGQLDPIDPAEQLLTDSPISHGKDSDVPALAIGDRSVDQYILPVQGQPLAFQTHDVGLANEVKLVPFYQQTSHRYAVYWDTSRK